MRKCQDFHFLFSSRTRVVGKQTPNQLSFNHRIETVKQMLMLILFSSSTTCSHCLILQVMPAMKYVCMLSSFSIGSIFLLQLTWMIAWISFDEKRVQAKNNFFAPCCMSHPNWEPNRDNTSLWDSIFKTCSQLLSMKAYQVCLYEIWLSHHYF